MRLHRRPGQLAGACSRSPTTTTRSRTRQRRHRPADRLPDQRHAGQRRRRPHRLPRPTTQNDGLQPRPGDRRPRPRPRHARGAAGDRCRSGCASSASTRRPDAPVVVIDATTGERWPIWIEIDSNATTPEETAVLIHPAKNFARRPSLHRRDAQPQGRRRRDARRSRGLPLLPRRPALEQGADQRPARPLREHLQEAQEGRHQARATSTSPGTSRSQATRTSPRTRWRCATTPSPSSATPTSATGSWRAMRRSFTGHRRCRTTSRPTRPRSRRTPTWRDGSRAPSRSPAT